MKGVLPLRTEDGLTREVVRAARRRVFPLLDNWWMMDHDVMRLLVSCYLQGCRDMVEVVAGNGERGSE